MKNKNLSLVEAKTPENTGGGNSRFLKHSGRYLTFFILAFVLGIGQMWGDTSYYLFTPTSAPNPSHTGTLSGNFVSPTASSDSRTIDTYTFTHKVNIGSALGTGKLGGSTAGNKSVDYHVKTTSTTFRVYLYNNSTSTAYTLYYATITEGSVTVSETSISVAASFSGYKEFTVSSTTNTTVGIYFDNTNIRIMQVIATESGTAHKQAGEAGYTLSFNKGRIALNSSKTITTEGLSIKCENNFTYASTESLTFKKNNPTANYLSFTTPAGGSKIKVTWSGGQIAYNTSAAAAGATSMTSGTEYTLNGSTTYYVINSSSGSGASITKLEFKAAAAKAYTVTAATSTGDNSLGTVSATASSLDATETTTITATPATGYRVTNWAVSGTGASISPSGASNATSTTLTMGTANATVTVTFGPKPYTVTLNNQSATTEGTESVTTAYNASTNLTSAITCPTKTGKVFAGYFTATNGGGVQLIDPAGNWIASAGGNSTYMDGSKNWKYDNNLTLYACWMEYATSIDFYTYVQSDAASISEGSTSTTYTILSDNKFLYSLQSSTALDNSTDGRYKGLKFKHANDYILFLIPANYSLSVKWGYVKTTKPKYSINGGAETEFSSITKQSDNQSVDMGSETYARLVKIKAMDGDAAVLKEVTITAPVSGYAITTSATNGSIATSVSSTAVTSAESGDKVDIVATPNTGYSFSAWDIYKTDASSTKVTPTAATASTSFTMPAYAVTVGATFTAINYTVTHSAATNGTYTIKVGTADAVGTNTTANYGQTVTLAATPASGYSFAGWTVMQGETPVSVSSNQFTMPAGNVTVSAAFAQEPNVYYYKNASRYDGETYKNPEGNAAGSSDNTALTTPWTICNGCVTGVTSVVATAARYDGKGDHMNAYIKLRKDDSGKIVFTIASGYKATIKIKMGGYSDANTNITMKLNDSGDNISYSGTMSGAGTTENGYAELTYANLAAGAYTLKPTSGSLYISQIDIQTTAVYTVTHTLTGVTTSSATKVDAGVAYNATYAASTGYTLPSTITVKVGGSTIDAENYTWTQATGALSIPAAQVTGNIQVIVAGDFTCPDAASGDVVFSWTPKTSLADADIAAGTYDLPGEWLESVYGGSAEIYVNANEAMRIRNNQLAFNGNNAYVHLTICALAEGDRILVNSSNETNARNLWISLSTTRPANAEAAAAVIEQGKAYYISSSSALKNATDLYIWRVSSTTQIGEVSIIRSKKFTVTYAASDLTDGEVPAAVNNIFDGQTITVAGQGTMEKGEMLFNGWKDANEVSYAAGDDLEVTANMTLTAQWSQLYTVTYAKAGTEEGAVPTQSSLLDGAEFTVADQGSLVTPANKEFGGWNDGTQTYAAGDTYTIDGANVTLTAVWNNSYTVQYDANGGTGTMSDGTGATVTIAANGFTYDGHKFLRWNTQQDGEGTNYAVGAEVSQSLTLYAIWKEVTCTAGTNIFSIEFTNSSAVTMSYNDPELDLSSYATISGGSAYMRYYNGTNTNKTVINSSKKVNYDSNNQYLKLVLDCALEEGDVITCADGTGNQIAIAVDMTTETNPASTSNKEVTSSYEYTVQAADHIVGKDVLFLGRSTSGGTTNGTITIYRPLPDAPVPTIDENTPADANYEAGATIAAMTVSADAEGAKALHYQWYKEAGETDIEVGTDAASYTPVASGDYYCVVTNSPTGYAPQSATSRTATITMISSDATLVWLKADGNDISLSDGVYAYEYVIDDDATVAPTITAAKNEENATVTITQADSKTGTATVHVVAQDGETSHDYTVKFNEFSGCLTAFYFPYATDAENNHVTNNEALRGHTVFTTTQTNSSSYTGTLTVGADEYPVTKSTGSAADFGNLVVPEKYTATLYLLFRTGGSNCSVQLAKTGETPTPYMTSGAYASQDVYQYNFENVQAGTYVIRVVKSNGDVQNSQYLAMAAELCRYEVSSVSLANMTLRTGYTSTPEMTITPAKGAIASQAWSFVDASTAEAAGLSINATTGAVTANSDATPGNYAVKVVLNGDNALSATCTVHVITEYSQVDVTGTTEWDFATGKAASSKITIGYGDKLLANVEGVTNDETFNSQALMVDANYVSNSQLQSKSVMFHATVPGLLTIRYACTSDKSGNYRVLYINNHETTSKTDKAEVEYTQVVPAGDVTIKAIYDNSGTPTVDIMNYKYIKFTAAAELDPAEAEESTLGGYERSLPQGQLGTICLPNGGVMVGASIYEIAYMDYESDGVTPHKIYFDEVINGVMEAGMPYVILADEGVAEFGVYYTDAAGADATDKNGLYGYMGSGRSLIENEYFIYNNLFYFVSATDAASGRIRMGNNRAFIKLAEVPGYNEPVVSTPAPGRRRVSMGNGSAPKVATGIEDVQGDEVQCTKVMINGQLFILRGEKMYDVRGQLVK